MRNKSLILMTICAALSTGLSAQSIYPGQHAGKMKKVTTAPIQVESFDLKDVRLLPSRFRDNMMRDSVWMISIATNRLLHSFRNNAGVFAGREGGYMTVKKLGGWESLDCELRGHTTGHLLSAYALMYASTGSEIFKLKGQSCYRSGRSTGSFGKRVSQCISGRIDQSEHTWDKCMGTLVYITQALLRIDRPIPLYR